METLLATQLLRNDHKVVKGLFRQAEGIESRAIEMKPGVMREMFMLLEIHTRIEEELFYPALKEHPRTAALVANSIEDHREVKEMIQNLRGLDPLGENYNDKLSELIDAVESHVETEESELFPIAEKVIPSRLEALGGKMYKLKQELMGATEYQDAQPGLVQDPNGGEQMRKTDLG